jgi:hypothetical protein
MYHIAKDSKQYCLAQVFGVDSNRCILIASEEARVGSGRLTIFSYIIQYWDMMLGVGDAKSSTRLPYDRSAPSQSVQDQRYIRLVSIQSGLEA